MMITGPVRTRFEQEFRAPFSRTHSIDIAQVPDTGTATLFTADDDADFLVTSLWVSNITGSAATLTLYLVPDGDTAADANAHLKGFSVAANERELICHPNGPQFLMRPSMTLQAVSGTSNALNMGGQGLSFLGGDRL